MTDPELRRALAEHLGYVWHHFADCGPDAATLIPPGDEPQGAWVRGERPEPLAHGHLSFVPDWPRSLDAMHALETELARRGLHLVYTRALTKMQDRRGVEATWAATHATARVKAEAALTALRGGGE